uniref:Uncharacterized protein n=1 Tax=Ralstonia solanacearum TaxID=305 RepID=A0A0S4UT67_RALSL|nr:protein of unknown function [Ralstonia solanacearum]CUV32465.1 protein of unknown function [Ralstonia solanacearum]CUV42071.1 protein of unknown function [Ralstonia solanacearum]CUV61808.1 protein of unknown function [Ralstonia solanacearum]
MQKRRQPATGGSGVRDARHRSASHGAAWLQPARREWPLRDAAASRKGGRDPGGLPNPGHPIPCAQAGIAPEADGGYGQVHERAEARPRIRLGRPAQGAAGKRRRHRSGSAQACAGLRGSA